MIDTTEEIKQNDLDIWLEDRISEALSQGQKAATFEKWQSKQKKLSTEHFKQFTRSRTIMTQAACKVLCRYLDILMSQATQSGSRQKVWRCLDILMEKIILDSGDIPADGPWLAECLLNQLQKTLDTGQLKQLISNNEAKGILTVYLQTLCLKRISVRNILDITYKLVKGSASLNEQLTKQLHKLDQWLQPRQISFEQTIILFNIITAGKLQRQMKQRDYSPRGFQIVHKTLLSALVRSLGKNQGDDREKFIVMLVLGLYDESSLLEPFTQLLVEEKSLKVVNEIMKYYEYQTSQYISVKKLKLILKNLQSPLPENKVIHLAKLKGYIEILKGMTRRYPQACVMAQFLSRQSSMVLENMIREKEGVLMLALDLCQVDKTCQILTLNGKKGPYTISISELKQGERRLVLTVKSDEKILIEDVIVPKWEGSGELMLLVSVESEGTAIQINAKSYSTKEKCDFSKIILGFNEKIDGFRGRVRALVIMSKDVPQLPELTRLWIECDGRLQAFLRQRSPQQILFKMSRGDSLFKNSVLKDKNFLQRMFSKQSNSSLIQVKTFVMPSMLQILEQLGHLDCLLYFIEHLNGLLQGIPEAEDITGGLFSILKLLCSNDQFYDAIDWVENSLANVGHLLWLLFFKNKQTAHCVRLIIKIFDFLLFFQRRLKYETNEQSLNTCYRNLQCQVMKSIFLKFDVWVLCGLTEQLFVLKVLEKRLQDQNILNNFKQSNCLGLVLISLLVHYNSDEHKKMNLLNEEQLNQMQDTLLNLVTLLLSDTNHVQRDIRSVILCIYGAQQTNFPYSNSIILKKMLSLLHNKILPLASFKKFFVQACSFNLTQRISYFFCHLARTTQQPAIMKMIIQIVMAIRNTVRKNTAVCDTILIALLRSLNSQARDFGFMVQPYMIVIRQLEKQDGGMCQHDLMKVVLALRQSYKFIGKLQQMEHLEEALTRLNNDTIIEILNSDEGFDFFLTVSVEQPDGSNYITRLLQNIFVFCASSEQVMRALPLMRNFLKVYHTIRLPNTLPEQAIHLMCEHIDSKYLVKMLHYNGLLSSQPNLRFMTVSEGQARYAGGTLGHILAKNSFAPQDIDIFKQLIKERPREIDTYCREDDLVQYLLPDIIFLQSLWTLLRNHMSEFKRKLTRRLSASGEDMEKQEEIIDQPTTALLQMMALSMSYASMLQNVNVFAQSTLFDSFSQLLVKEPNKQLLLKGYLELNEKIEFDLPSMLKNKENSNQILQKFKKLLQNKQLTAAYTFVRENRPFFQELLRQMNKYCKKDMNIVRKLWLTTREEELVRRDSHQHTAVEYRQEQTNNFIVELQKTFKEELKKIDRSSQASEELWRTLNNKNRFWLWGKKGDGDIYKVDLHESPNFYHLNLKIARSQQLAQYPRRIKQDEPKLEKSQLILNISSMTEIKRMESQTSQGLMSKSAVVELDSTQQGFKYYVEYVTQRGVHFGYAWRKGSNLIFRTVQDKPPGRQYELSTSTFHQLHEFCQRTIDLKDAILYTRRYVLRHTAVEIYSHCKSYFLNLFTQEKRRLFINDVKDLFKNCIVNRKQEFLKQDFTKKWLNGELNNFEYLMIINKYSGRTLHDLSQYPVFPWVVANYTPECKQLNKDFLKEPNNLRNLQLPMGKQNPTRFEGYKIRMDEAGVNDPQNHFLYGSFYSNPTFMYNFFIRLQPFTTLHWQHQGQKIDHADRLFFGIQEQYRSATTNTSDVRELVPQFYYWPEFLRNRNQVELGHKQNKQIVDDARLPGWARTPQEFVFRMRQALESPQVTEQLSSWIDLIFGYKASYEQAQKYDNLFHYYTYERDMFKMVDVEMIKLAQLNISQFGQVPEQLFQKEHPKKKARQGLLVDHYRQIYHKEGATTFELCQQGLMLVSCQGVDFLSTNFNIVSKADATSFNSIGDNCTLLKEREFSWVTVHQRQLHFYVKGKKRKQSIRIDSNTYYLSSKELLIWANGSQLLVQQLTGLQELAAGKKPLRLYGHQETVCIITANQNMDVLFSMDLDGLVLIHYLSTLQLVRMFKLRLNVDEEVLQVRLHDMGYFVFLTSQNRLFIYTFQGQIFVNSDLTSEVESQRVTNMQFISEWQSIILLSTTRGNIYQLDFFELWQFKQQLAHLPFKLKKKNSILSRCREDCTKDVRYRDGEHPEILHFEILKSANEFKVLFKILVLFAGGKLTCFYEKEMMKEQIQNSPLLKQMGIL